MDPAASPSAPRPTGTEVVAQSVNLARVIHGLVAETRRAARVDIELLDALKEAQHCLPVIQQHISNTFPPEAFVHQCPPHALDIAQTAFDVPEMLEMILSHLGISDLLTSRLVNSQFQSAIDGSPSLQRRMMLLPSDSSDLYAPFAHESLPGFNCKVKPKYDDVSHSQSIELYMWFANPLPKIGPLGRKMLVVQPPIFEISFLLDCGCWRGEEYRGKFTSHDGITIGDLLRAAAQVKFCHTECPFVYARHIDPETGHRNAQLYFKATITLRSDDPFSRAQSAERRAAAAAVAKQAGVTSRMSAYSKARLDGIYAPVVCLTKPLLTRSLSTH